MSTAPVAAATVNNLKGALILSFATIVYTLEVVLFRKAGIEASTAQIMMFRALGQLVVGTLMVLATADGAAFRTKRPMLQVARGLASLATWYLYYLSFLLLDLALATTLTFATSLFVVILAAPVLGERVGPVRLGATFVGFAGVVIATGIGIEGFDPAVLVGLGSAVCASLLVFLNRVLVRTERSATIMFYIGVVVTAGAVPLAILDWQPVSAATLAVLALAGLIGAGGMWLTIEAYRAGEVSALAPFPYLRIVFAVAAGYLVFAELPGWHTLIGTIIIVAATLYVTRSERRRGLATPQRP